MLQSLIQQSIRHRWMVLVLTLAAAAVGVRSLAILPIDAVPDITNNQVQINTVVPALSPIEVEKQVTFTVETALAGIPGLESTRSLSRNGFSQVTAIFEDRIDIYFARQQVAERMAQAKESLPPGAEPAMGPIATGLGEIYMYTVEFEHPRGAGAPAATGPGWQREGEYLSPEGRLLRTELEFASYLREVQDWIIRPQLKTVAGVAGVDTIGGSVRQYHIRPDPMKLISYGLTFSEVVEAIEHNNLSAGAGYIEHKGETYLVRATGRIESPAQIEDIVVASRQGVPIRVRDVVLPGGVGIGPELRTGSASENGREVVVGTAVMLIGSNSRTVAAAVDERVRQLAQSLPPDVRVKPVLNRTKLVDATIATVRRNLFEGAVLVVAVLLTLLGNARAAIICAAAIPLSMLVTATGMVRAGVSGNLMSLGAIDFGLIVDGAVIIVENCLRRLAERQHREGRLLTPAERLEEVGIASREMARPSLFGQAIILTVYLPILALTGVEGKMFHPMAITVMFALIAALVLSLTFVPAMVALLVRGRVAERDMVLVRWAKAAYAPTLAWALRLRWAVAGAACAAFVGSLLLFTRLGQEFVPTLDEHDLAMHAMRIPSTSLSQSQAMQFDVERAISRIPEVAFVFSKTGTAEMATDLMPPNVSDTFIILKDRSAWRSEPELEEAIAAIHAPGQGDEAHEDEDLPRVGGPKGKLIRLIQSAAQTVPGNNYEFTQPIQMRFNELISGVRGDVAVKVYGDDFGAMEQTASRVLDVLRGVRGVADSKVEQTEGLPVMTVAIDREAIARYGLDIADVQDIVAIAIGGRSAGLVFEGDRRFDIIVRLPEDLRADINALESLPVPLPAAPAETRQGRFVNGAAAPRGPGFVPLGAIASIGVAEGTNQVSRENGKRRIVVQCNVRGRDLGSFVQEAQAKVGSIALPTGQWIGWGGQFESLIAARARLAIVVPLCFAIIFLILFSTFRHVRPALLVFSAVPLGLTGGILALWIRGMPFSISAAVGFIALSGVAVLNGLVMVTLINDYRREGLGTEQAILRGCLVRLRPVLMTALVASFGFIPMALANGTGSEVQKPLATVVIGGLVSSTLLTLIVLPALYRLVDHRQA